MNLNQTKRKEINWRKIIERKKYELRIIIETNSILIITPRGGRIRVNIPSVQSLATAAESSRRVGFRAPGPNKCDKKCELTINKQVQCSLDWKHKRIIVIEIKWIIKNYHKNYHQAIWAPHMDFIELVHRLYVIKWVKTIYRFTFVNAKFMSRYQWCIEDKPGFYTNAYVHCYYHYYILTCSTCHFLFSDEFVICFVSSKT